jgi:hypothetical protein
MSRRVIVRTALSSIVPLLLTLLPVAAFAQGSFGTLDYRPFQATSVPTLGTLGLVLTAIMLAVVAIKLLRFKQGSHMVIALVGASLLLFAAGGGQLFGLAYAVAPAEMTNPNGGRIEVFCFGGTVKNGTGVAQQITAIDCRMAPINEGTSGASAPAVNGTLNGNGGVPTCDVGTVLANEEQCVLGEPM